MNAVDSDDDGLREDDLICRNKKSMEEEFRKSVND
jgi:hypothetical protein